MTRLAPLSLILSLALVPTVSTVATAGPTRAQADAASTRSHSYWLSRDFQRLVFWQPPQASGRR